MSEIERKKREKKENVVAHSSGHGGGKGKSKVHPCTGTEALYRPYGP